MSRNLVYRVKHSSSKGYESQIVLLVCFKLSLAVKCNLTHEKEDLKKLLVETLSQNKGGFQNHTALFLNGW